MRRLVVVVALVGVGVFGLGSAFVLAGGQQAGPGAGKIDICHATSSESNPFVLESPNASGDLNGHENHPNDIIPPFILVENGTATHFPGKNMNAIYGAGWTGAEVLASNCDIPNGTVTGSTQTVTTTITQTVPVTVTTPGTTITLPAVTTSKEVTVTVTVPTLTVTTPGTTTVITVPSGVTTTVTLPTRIVTLAAVTETIGGETVERPPLTVTLAATTTTVAAGATATVVTVTGPNKAVHEGVLATKHAHITVTTPRRVVRLHAHVIHVVGTGKFAGKKLIVVVVRSGGCPPGTVLYQDACTGVVRGKG